MVRNEVRELVVDVVEEVAPQLVEIDAAGTEDRDGVLVLGQREQEMLQRRVFVAALVREGESAVEGLLEIA
jgi:hypothetical protein